MPDDCPACGTTLVHPPGEVQIRCPNRSCPAQIQQGLQHKKLVAQSRRLLQEHMKTQNLLEELERANPGITQIEMDEDGAIVMEDDEGGAEDVQSLLDDLEREMSKVARR